MVVDLVSVCIEKLSHVDLDLVRRQLLNVVPR